VNIFDVIVLREACLYFLFSCVICCFLPFAPCRPWCWKNGPNLMDYVFCCFTYL